MPDTPFHPLDPALHNFAADQFGTLNDLRSLNPNDDGWSAIMVTCSELGYQPDQNSIFEVGQLYTLQNFGNVVLPLPGSELETEVSAALTQNELQDLIICGHLACQTVEHFLWNDRDNEWLEHGNKLRHFMASHYGDLDEKAKLNVAAQENVLLQVEKVVRSLGVKNTPCRLFAWMSDRSSNRIFHFDPTSGQFVK